MKPIKKAVLAPNKSKPPMASKVLNNRHRSESVISPYPSAVHVTTEKYNALLKSLNSPSFKYMKAQAQASII